MPLTDLARGGWRDVAKLTGVTSRDLPVLHREKPGERFWRLLFYWLFNAIVSAPGAIVTLVLATELLGRFPGNPVSEAIFQPGFYREWLGIDASNVSWTPERPYNIWIRGETPPRWSWTTPLKFPHSEVTLRWKSYTGETHLEGDAKLDMGRLLILRQGSSYPLDLESFAAVTQIDTSIPENRKRLTGVLEALEHARAGRARHPGYTSSSIRIETHTLGFFPFPLLISQAAFMALVFVMTKGAGGRFRRG